MIVIRSVNESSLLENYLSSDRSKPDLRGLGSSLSLAHYFNELSPG